MAAPEFDAHMSMNGRVLAGRLTEMTGRAEHCAKMEAFETWVCERLSPMRGYPSNLFDDTVDVVVAHLIYEGRVLLVERMFRHGVLPPARFPSVLVFLVLFRNAPAIEFIARHVPRAELVAAVERMVSIWRGRKALSVASLAERLGRLLLCGWPEVAIRDVTRVVLDAATAAGLVFPL